MVNHRFNRKTNFEIFFAKPHPRQTLSPCHSHWIHPLNSFTRNINLHFRAGEMAMVMNDCGQLRASGDENENDEIAEEAKDEDDDKDDDDIDRRRRSQSDSVVVNPFKKIIFVKWKITGTPNAGRRSDVVVLPSTFIHLSVLSLAINLMFY